MPHDTTAENLKPGDTWPGMGGWVTVVSVEDHDDSPNLVTVRTDSSTWCRLVVNRDQPYTVIREEVHANRAGILRTWITDIRKEAALLGDDAVQVIDMCDQALSVDDSLRP